MSQLNIQQILIRILVLTLSLSVHEYAHAWMANRLGDDTAKRQGRLTLSPMQHIDIMGAIAFILLGFGWAKPVPVNPARFSRDKVKTIRSGMMKVSIAGPVSNLIIAFISYFILQLSIFITHKVGLTSNLMTGSINPLTLWIAILSTFYYSNIFLAIFNMLPVPPLDGSKVLGAFLPDKLYYQYMSWQRYTSMILLVLFVLGGGIISRILSAIAMPVEFVISKPIDLLFSLIS